MMLKVGDRLLCKKDIIRYYDIEYQKFVIGKYYIIVEKDKYNYLRILDRFGFGGWYSIDKLKGSKYILDYFYTPQEVRRLKLKQLNDVKSR